MGFRRMERYFTHMFCHRWTVCLLSVVTMVYVLIHLFWIKVKDVKDINAEFFPGPLRGSRLEHMLSPELNGEDNHVREGTGVWIKGRDIQVISAIHDINHAVTSQTRVVLPSFLKHSSQRDFFCCFHSSLIAYYYTQVPAQLDFIDLRFVVDMQNALFECLLNITQPGEISQVKFVSFSSTVCGQKSSLPLRVVHPVRRTWEFAVCTKVAYARLEPSRLVEWFEYMREIGASKIVTFYNNLHPDSKRVFEYYADTDFLELIEYKPQITRNGSRMLYSEKNSQTRQARHTKTLVVRDCQFRLGGYDFVITIDFDEIPVPMRPYGSLNWIFQDLLRNHTDGSAFRMDPILLPPIWQNHTQDLFHWRFNTGTYIAPYCIKWAYIPARTWLAATHENMPKKGFQTYLIPENVLHFLHFRSCKSEWTLISCHNLTATVQNELTLKRFYGLILESLKKLPLEELVPDRGYVQFVRGGGRAGASKKELNKDNFHHLLDNT